MITNCRSCKSDKLINILDLGNQYLSDFVDKKAPKPEAHPLELVLCKDCTLLQLKETTPSSSLYNNNYGYKSGISNTMKNELFEISCEAVTHGKLSINDVVVDIGANDGTLLSYYQPGLYRVAFEPIEKYAQEIYLNQRAEFVVNDFFSSQLYFKYVSQKAKIITAISMFYDLDDPNRFVANLKEILAEDGIIIIQQNYLVKMLKNYAYDNVVHEHLEYYSLTSLEKLLNRHQLEVYDVKETKINGGSFRTYVRHMDRVKVMRYEEKKLGLEKNWPYIVFGMQIKHLKNELYKFIKSKVDEGKTIYLYGASTRGNTILQYCDLDYKLIKAAVERNPEKFGKKIASVDIPIISEEQARKEKPDYMLVLPWFFKDEIIKREEDYLKSGGHLIFPLPNLKII